jgi:hypothetical protein
MSRKRLGWLHRSRIRSLPAAGLAETITLAALNRPDIDGYQMVEFVGTSRVGPNAVSTYTVEFRERSGWDQGLNSSTVIVHEIRSDGLVRLLTNNPIGTIGVGSEFVSPSPSRVVRVESIDAPSHAARLRTWRLPVSGTRDLRIVTILFDPMGPEPRGEFVMIQNDRSSAVDLAGWTLSDAAQHVYTFPAFTLPPGGTVKVWTGTGTSDAENLFWGRRQAVWNNTGDIGILRNVAGTEVSRFAYTA